MLKCSADCRSFFCLSSEAAICCAMPSQLCGSIRHLYFRLAEYFCDLPHRNSVATRKVADTLLEGIDRGIRTFASLGRLLLRFLPFFCNDLCHCLTHIYRVLLPKVFRQLYAWTRDLLNHLCCPVWHRSESGISIQQCPNLFLTVGMTDDG
ncbi:MAG: hypothetical protein HDQ87_06130 [Clostridia bacterium]|nr:hypothetical protein [Clostridia bacterium]